jgi:dienelactone hydrolase
MRYAKMLLLLGPLVVAGACGSDGGPGGGGDDDSSGDGAGTPDAAPVVDFECEGAQTLAPPADYGARGPWPVGARTVTVNGLTTEVWYPAQLGSEAGQERAVYDIRKHLPDADAAKIPDADNPWQVCDCFRDLPLDESHGPYPVVLFIHGTAGFRTQSLTFMTHWASRGFVVVASDHPKIMLKDALQFMFGGDQAGDARKVLDVLAAPAGELAFLAGRIDMNRVGMVGHSAGGGAISGFGTRPGVRVLVPMASRGVGAGTMSSLIMGGMDDGIAQYSQVKQGFGAAQPKKRLVGIEKAGHLAFSDLCFIGRDQGGILQIALDHGVMVNQLIASLARDGCMEGQLSAERGWEIINWATAAVLEESLLCGTPAPNLGDIQTRFPEVKEYEELL